MQSVALMFSVQRMQNGIIFYDYHAVGMSRPALLSVSSAVGLVCVISSALDSDGDIKCYSLCPFSAKVLLECDCVWGGGERVNGWLLEDSQSDWF